MDRGPVVPHLDQAKIAKLPLGVQVFDVADPDIVARVRPADFFVTFAQDLLRGNPRRLLEPFRNVGEAQIRSQLPKPVRRGAGEVPEPGLALLQRLHGLLALEDFVAQVSGPVLDTLFQGVAQGADLANFDQDQTDQYGAAGQHAGEDHHQHIVRLPHAVMVAGHLPVLLVQHHEADPVEARG